MPGFGVGRDGCRTPMQYGTRAQMLSFSAAALWLPLAEDFAAANVAPFRDDQGPLLNPYRCLTALRRTRPALTRRLLPGGHG